MRNEQAKDAGFPGIAFATLPNTGETIAIRYGERICYRVDSAKTADELNAIYGVTQAQAKALLASVITTWEVPQTNQESHGAPRRST
ncbi:MAG: hypothetical protein ACYC9L_11505 [Sulfuricaulis sp.]